MLTKQDCLSTPQRNDYRLTQYVNRYGLVDPNGRTNFSRYLTKNKDEFTPSSRPTLMPLEFTPTLSKQVKRKNALRALEKDREHQRYWLESIGRTISPEVDGDIKRDLLHHVLEQFYFPLCMKEIQELPFILPAPLLYRTYENSLLVLQDETPPKRKSSMPYSYLSNLNETQKSRLLTLAKKFNIVYGWNSTQNYPKSVFYAMCFSGLFLKTSPAPKRHGYSLLQYPYVQNTPQDIESQENAPRQESLTESTKVVQDEGRDVREKNPKRKSSSRTIVDDKNQNPTQKTEKKDEFVKMREERRDEEYSIYEMIARLKRIDTIFHWRAILGSQRIAKTASIYHPCRLEYVLPTNDFLEAILKTYFYFLDSRDEDLPAEERDSHSNQTKVLPRTELDFFFNFHIRKCEIDVDKALYELRENNKKYAYLHSLYSIDAPPVNEVSQVDGIRFVDDLSSDKAHPLMISMVSVASQFDTIQFDATPLNYYYEAPVVYINQKHSHIQSPVRPKINALHFKEDDPEECSHEASINENRFAMKESKELQRQPEIDILNCGMSITDRLLRSLRLSLLQPHVIAFLLYITPSFFLPLFNYYSSLKILSKKEVIAMTHMSPSGGFALDAQKSSPLKAIDNQAQTFLNLLIKSLSVSRSDEKEREVERDGWDRKERKVKASSIFKEIVVQEESIAEETQGSHMTQRQFLTFFSDFPILSHLLSKATIEKVYQDSRATVRRSLRRVRVEETLSSSPHRTRGNSDPNIVPDTQGNRLDAKGQMSTNKDKQDEEKRTLNSSVKGEMEPYQMRNENSDEEQQVETNEKQRNSVSNSRRYKKSHSIDERFPLIIYSTDQVVSKDAIQQEENNSLTEDKSMEKSFIQYSVDEKDNDCPLLENEAAFSKRTVVLPDHRKSKDPENEKKKGKTEKKVRSKSIKKEKNAEEAVREEKVLKREFHLASFMESSFLCVAMKQFHSGLLPQICCDANMRLLWMMQGIYSSIKHAQEKEEKYQVAKKKILGKLNYVVMNILPELKDTGKQFEEIIHKNMTVRARDMKTLIVDIIRNTQDHFSFSHNDMYEALIKSVRLVLIELLSTENSKLEGLLEGILLDYRTLLVPLTSSEQRIINIGKTMGNDNAYLRNLLKHYSVNLYYPYQHSKRTISQPNQPRDSEGSGSSISKLLLSNDFYDFISKAPMFQVKYTYSIMYDLLKMGI